VEPHGQGRQPHQLRLLRHAQRRGADTHTHSDADTDAASYADTDADADAHSDTHADTDTDANADADTDTDTGQCPDGAIHRGLEVGERRVLHARGDQ
jgi:hypothetical protein